MAYRRRQGITRSSTFKEDPETDDNNPNKPCLPLLTASHSFSPTSSHSFSPTSLSSPSQSLAAQAIRASATHRQSTLSDSQRSRAFSAYEDASLKNESKGFWGVLARKAKSILDDEHVDDASQQPAAVQQAAQQHTYESFRNVENEPSFRRGLDKITYSLNQIGDSFEKAFEEGKTIVENKTADIIQETRKLQIRRQGQGQGQGQGGGLIEKDQLQLPMTLAQNQTQLKASRDVAMATAAKAKLLLRELKSVKADLAFAKQRCGQLEEENKLLRESREKGQNPADDDLIRLQLETLLAEKARLAHDNSVFARENRFLREIVEYHQLTMQDVVYFDQDNQDEEDDTDLYPNMLCATSSQEKQQDDSTSDLAAPPSTLTKEGSK